MKGGRCLLVLAILLAIFISLGIYLGQCSASEDQMAWKEFASLVHPVKSGTGAAQSPDWIFWATKCEAGFSTACDDNPRKSPVPADRTAAEIPRQVLDRFDKSQPQDK